MTIRWWCSGDWAHPGLIVDLGTFVFNVADIKRRATTDSEPSPAGSSEEDGAMFSPELEGVRTAALQATIEAQCRHGTVVRLLHDALAELGWTSSNDRGRDLVARRGRTGPTITFEVKTDTSTQSVFTGVGQLVVHARPRATGDGAVLVVPDTLPAAMDRILAAEGIRVLRFAWDGDDRIVFAQLATVLREPGSARA